MLSEIMNLKEINSQEFQVLFLRNDDSQEVEVQEVNKVDFTAVQEHLDQGESVFITSRSTQKLKAPNQISSRKLKTRLATSFYFEHV